eukprot:6183951-Pleurochrysis_carterae.AAC.3
MRTAELRLCCSSAAFLTTALMACRNVASTPSIAPGLVRFVYARSRSASAAVSALSSLRSASSSAAADDESRSTLGVYARFKLRTRRRCASTRPSRETSSIGKASAGANSLLSVWLLLPFEHAPTPLRLDNLDFGGSQPDLIRICVLVAISVLERFFGPPAEQTQCAAQRIDSAVAH